MSIFFLVWFAILGVFLVALIEGGILWPISRAITDEEPSFNAVFGIALAGQVTCLVVMIPAAVLQGMIGIPEGVAPWIALLLGVIFAASIVTLLFFCVQKIAAPQSLTLGGIYAALRLVIALAAHVISLLFKS